MSLYGVFIFYSYINMPYELKWTKYFKVFCTYEDLTPHPNKYWESLLREKNYVIKFYNLEFELQIKCYEDTEDNVIWTDAYLDYNWHPCYDWQRDWEILWEEKQKISDEVCYYLYKNTSLILSLTGH